jgi:16S rRNA C967 or C1407 C5-methylase (RsmB/RsmF family)
VLKPGGTLVYSTCALSPWENDDVMGKLFERREDVETTVLDLPIGEKTKHGWQILPDTTGRGPFYLSRVTKKIT